jgi:hypothetical protein
VKLCRYFRPSAACRVRITPNDKNLPCDFTAVHLP